MNKFINEVFSKLADKKILVNYCRINIFYFKIGILYLYILCSYKGIKKIDTTI